MYCETEHGSESGAEHEIEQEYEQETKPSDSATQLVLNVMMWCWEQMTVSVAFLSLACRTNGRLDESFPPHANMVILKPQSVLLPSPSIQQSSSSLLDDETPGTWDLNLPVSSIATRPSLLEY